MALTLVQTSGKFRLMADDATKTITMPANFGAGNTVIISYTAYVQNAQNLASMLVGGVDSAVMRANNTAANDRFGIWSVENTSSGLTNTVVVSRGSGSPTFWGLTATVEEWADLDGFVSMIDTGTGTSTAPTFTTPTISNVLLYGLWSYGNDGAAPTTITGPAAPWTSVLNESEGNNYESAQASYKLIGSAVAETGTATLAASHIWYSAAAWWTAPLPASDAASESAGMRQLRRNPIYRMSPRSEREAQQYLRAQKRAYGFAPLAV